MRVASLFVLLVSLAACVKQETPAVESLIVADSAVESDQIGAVTDALLRIGHRGQPATWPTYGGDWAQTRYSSLDQIQRENVSQLRPAWIAQTGVLGTFEATPIVLGLEMYVTTPAEQGLQKVLRLDSTTGETVWQVDLESEERSRLAATEDGHLPRDFGPHRGVAVYGDSVYVGTLNGSLLALRRDTGDRIFEVQTDSPRITGAPLAAQGRIIVGLSWVDRGAVQAFDAKSGDLLWTWHTIPSPQDGGWWGDWIERLPGREEIDLGRDIAQEKANQVRLSETWRTGGGSAPMTPTFDHSLGLVYISIGGPDPHGFPPPAEPHPGDMRWTNSICALHIENGSMAWCYQFLPHDTKGASGPTPGILINLNIEGRMREAVARFSGLGNLYVWDRKGGELLGVSDNYIPVENTTGGKAGANLIGVAGTVWSPGAYSFETGLLYSTNRRMPEYFEPRETQRPGGEYGNIAAVNPITGEVVWTRQTEKPMAGGTLATAGGLVFAGRTTGWFDAYDATTGERLWSFRTGAGCNSAPVTYEVAGRQYVAVSCGGHGLLDPESGDAIVAFSLVPD